MTLIVMRGLPASGKSSMAEKLVTSGARAVRLNKDLARTMLHFDRWTSDNERLTHMAMEASARALLAYADVIIDDTNLNPRVMRQWEDVARDCHAKFVVHDLTDVSVEECIARDAGRDRCVGENVIRSMAERYLA